MPTQKIYVGIITFFLEIVFQNLKKELDLILKFKN